MVSFTTAQLRQHADKKDAWIALHGKVYNITTFLSQHPGGADILLDQLGEDATASFESIGHSENAYELIKKYYIGEYNGAKDTNKQFNTTSAKARSVIQPAEPSKTPLNILLFSGFLGITAVYVFFEQHELVETLLEIFHI